MTTHGRRVSSVHLAIESIAAGAVRPRRIVLWLDDADLYANLPIELERLQARGLEVELTENYGPHTKYWPYVRSLSEHELDSADTLITADDDMILPRYWLDKLLSAASDSTMTCYRAHSVGFDADGGLLPYATWEECWTSRASFANFPTGVSGLAYARPMVRELRSAGTDFVTCTPKADDVWLHHISVEANIPTKQVFSLPLEFPVAPSSQETGLYLSNVGEHKNDKQIAATYSERTVTRVREAAGQRALHG